MKRYKMCKNRFVFKQVLLVHVIMYLLVVFTAVAGTEVDADDLYKVGVEDIISIKVVDNPEFSITAQVNADGTIAYPYLGVITVKDLTLEEIKNKLVDELSAGYIRYPIVTVSLVNSASRKIYSYGQFNRRGEIPYIDNLTIIKAFSMASGVGNDGLFGKLTVLRKHGDSNAYEKLVVARLNNGLLFNPKIENMILEPDDILIVEKNETFLIQGEVSRRGRIVLEKDMTVLRALLEAGGVTDKGLYGRIKIRRKQSGESGKYKDMAESQLDDGVILDSKVENMILEPDDILIVEKNETFLIQGEVARRGRIVLEKGMTVLRALLEAGGATESGLCGRIIIRRKQPGENEKYEDMAESQLNDGAIVSAEVENIMLQHDDILVVTKNDTFFVFGEANNIGEFVLKNDMTVFKALILSGGFTKWGSEDRVRILRPTMEGSGFEIIKIKVGDILDGDASADAKIQKGDIIIVSTGLF